MKGIARVIPAVIAGRSRAMFHLNARSFFHYIFKVIKYFLDPTTIAKIQITTNPTNPMVNDLIADE